MIKAVHSLSFRLTALFAAVFVLCLASIFLGLDTFLRRSLVARTDAALTAELSRFSEMAARRKDRIIQSEFDRYAQHYGMDRVFLRLRDKDGNNVAMSDTNGWNEPSFLMTVPPLRADTNQFYSFTLAGVPVRSAYTYDSVGRMLQIAHAVDDAPFFSFFRRLVLVALLLSLLLGTAITYFTLSRAMRRIAHVRDTARRIAAGEPFARVTGNDHRDEIGQLSQTFNFMLDRMEALVQELQHLGVDIAHELRTPVTRIRGTAEALLMSPSGSAGDPQAAGIILEECDDLARTIDSMLQIARLESGRAPAAQEEVDIVALLGTAVEAFSCLAEDARVSLHTALPPPVRVRGDASMLQRAFSNLLDNAIKFTPAGGRVEVRCEVSASALQVTVADTGIGIRPECLPHIFDRFYRDAAHARTRGAGLGLSLVRAIVRAHGGTIRAESQPEQGSTFTVTLPRLDS